MVGAHYLRLVGHSNWDAHCNVHSGSNFEPDQNCYFIFEISVLLDIDN